MVKLLDLSIFPFFISLKLYAGNKAIHIACLTPLWAPSSSVAQRKTAIPKVRQQMTLYRCTAAT